MTSSNQSPLLEADRFLDDIGQFIRRTAPELLDIFQIYRGEARFGRMLIDNDLRRLAPGAPILEVGAGSLMLSSILRWEGYEITALEPTGSGFSHFTRLQEIVLEYGRQQGNLPRLLRCPGEDLALSDQFELVFSINVMEHVEDVAQVLRKVHRALKVGGYHRFVCPNYAFPYEPHFNIPILFNRLVTQRLLWRWIAGSKRVLDPVGVWSSLNWISIRQVQRLCRACSMAPSFGVDIFESYVDRAQFDHEFRARHGAFLIGFANLLRRSRMLRVARLLPTALLPVMDCRIVRAG